ncbi:MAG: dihydrofolate reductase [Halodesulfurarchaeum sp.]
MKLALIVAVAENGVIGDGTSIPWHYPEDLKHFKERTLGHPVIMGRRTYEAIRSRLDEPLPGRLSIVLTTEGIEPTERAVSVESVPGAIEVAAETDAEVAFVAGGASVYEQFLPRADLLYLTRIPEKPEGDTHFPDWDRSAWTLLDREKRGDLTFLTYERAE